MPPRRIYDDAVAMAKVDRAMGRGDYPTITAAIKGEIGDGEVRRLQDRFRERQIAVRAATMAAVSDAHAVSHPILVERGRDVRTFTVRVPDDAGGTWTVMAMLETSPSGEGRGLTCRVSGGAGPTPWPGPWGALEALGLLPVVRRGLHEVRAGPSPVLERLAATLRSAWDAAGVGDATEADALSVEGGRLSRDALDELSAALGPGSLRIVACHGTIGEATGVGAAAVPGASPARRLLMDALASTPHPGLAVMHADEAAAWAGRPAEVLARLHGGDGAAARLGRVPDLHDANWLQAVIGRHAIAPLHPASVLDLIASKGSVDPARVTCARDAAGLAAMVGAASRLCPSDGGQALDLLFARLDAGVDANRPYGDVADELWDVAEGDLPRVGLMGHALRRLGPFDAVVAAATTGVERLCEWSATHLLVPTSVHCAATRHGVGSVEVLASAIDADPAWPRRIERHAREVVEGGRGAAALARLALGFGLWEDAGVDLGPYLVDGPTLAATALDWAARAADATAVEAEWSRMSRWLSPRWRVDGCRAYADKASPYLTRLRGDGQAPASGMEGLIRSVGRIVGKGVRAFEGGVGDDALGHAPRRQRTT